MVTDSLVGSLPDEWEVVPLAEACSRQGGGIQTGPFGSQLHAADYVPEGIPSVMPENIGDNRIEADGIARIRMADAERLDRYRLKVDDIVYSRRGDVGRRALVRSPEDGWLCGTGCLRIRLGTGELVPEYLSYYLGHPAVRRWILQHSVGATMSNLNTAILGAVPVAVPPLHHQLGVASVLGALDAKIEVNQKVAANLEQIARTLFRSWFVDFDPVRGSATVPDDIRQLFPDRLVDSAVGPVPEGWHVEPLGEHVEVTRGLSYTGAGLADEGMPLHNLNSIREGGGYKEEGIKHYVGEYRDRDIVHPGDLIVANTEQGFGHLLIGYPAIVPASFVDEGLFSHHLYRLDPLTGSSLTRRWVYLRLIEERMHHVVAGYSNGTTVNMLPKDGLTRPMVAVPPSELVQRFDAIVAPMFEQQEVLAAESKTLAELRDALLPKLLSGEVRLRQPVG